MPMLPGKPSVLYKMVNPRRYIDKSYMARIAPEIYGGDLRRDPDAIEMFTSHARAGSKHGCNYQLLAMAGWTSFPWLWRIRQRTLVLAGTDDPLIPLINARLHAALLPKARLVEIDDGHLFLLTRVQIDGRHRQGFSGRGVGAAIAHRPERRRRVALRPIGFLAADAMQNAGNEYVVADILKSGGFEIAEALANRVGLAGAAAHGFVHAPQSRVERPLAIVVQHLANEMKLPRPAAKPHEPWRQRPG